MMKVNRSGGGRVINGVNIITVHCIHLCISLYLIPNIKLIIKKLHQRIKQNFQMGEKDTCPIP